MSDMTGKARLFAKMAAIMGDLKQIQKNGRNNFHKYDYATESDVADAIRPLLAKHGVALFAEIIHAERVPIENAKMRTTLITMRFTLACAETGASMECLWMCEGEDTNDKGLNKAASAGEKYFLLKTFVASSGDEAQDADSGLPTDKHASANKPAAKAAPAKTTPRPSVPPPDGYTPPADVPTDELEATTANDIVSYVEVRATEAGKNYIVAEGGLVTFTRKPFQDAGIDCEGWTTAGEKHVLLKPVLVRYTEKNGHKTITEVEAA